MLTLTLVLVSIGMLIYLVKSYFGRNNNFWKTRGVVELNNDLTLGELLQGKKSPPDLDVENYKFLGEQKYGGIVEFGTPMLLVKDLDLIKQVMVKDFDHFVDHRQFIKTDPLFSDSLFFLHGDDWRNMRNFLSPTFTSGKIRRMFHHFKRSGDKLTTYIQKEHPKLDGGHEILVADIVGRFTSDVIGAVAFGMETDTLTKKDSHFFSMALRSNDLTTSRLVKFALFSFFPSIANFFRMEVNDKDVSLFFRGLLMSAFRSREQSGEVREDFLQLLIEAKKEHGSTFSEEIIVAQAFLFFMAGFDTIANLLGESLYILALNPDIQEKLYAEVEEAMSNGNGDISYEAANKMEYMEMVISEVLRMFAPVARLERRCVKKWTIPGTKVELTEGTMIGVPATAIHHDPKHYENPEEFNPERFNASNKAARNPYTYLPFGTGPRNCIGMRLALIEAKVALAVMIYNFNVRPIPGKTPIPVKLESFFGFIRIPRTLQLSMVPRTH